MTKSNIVNGACAAAMALMLPLSGALAASATQTAYTARQSGGLQRDAGIARRRHPQNRAFDGR
jgi:hypothetical protein